MDVELFSLCDAATHSGMKMNILGAFDRVHAKQFPMTHPHCAIALRVRFDKIEEGDHKFRISMMDADGQSVLPGLEGNIGVKFPPQVQSVCANMVLNINGLKLPHPGQYGIDLAVDGRHEKSLPLNVVHLQPSHPPSNERNN